MTAQPRGLPPLLEREALLDPHATAVSLGRGRIRMDGFRRPSLRHPLPRRPGASSRSRQMGPTHAKRETSAVAFLARTPPTALRNRPRSETTDEAVGPCCP